MEWTEGRADTEPGAVATGRQLSERLPRLPGRYRSRYRTASSSSWCAKHIDGRASIRGKKRRRQGSDRIRARSAPARRGLTGGGHVWRQLVWRFGWRGFGYLASRRLVSRVAEQRSESQLERARRTLVAYAIGAENQESNPLFTSEMSCLGAISKGPR